MSASREGGAAAVAPVEGSAREVCANCGAAVPGHYCGNCGQRVEHAVHSLWHFTREVAEDLTHADSRLWRTLAALLFEPGFLTREFLAGRRMRYLPPLRLYLVLSLLFFLGATAFHLNPDIVVARPGNDGKISFEAADEPLQPGEDSRQHAQRVCAKVSYDGPWRATLAPAMRTACANAVEDHGRAVRESFIHNLPRAIFLAVPILAVAMKPLYWRPRRYYVEHLLFLLHNHAFLFVWLGLFTIVTTLVRIEWLTWLLALGVGLYIPYYYYRAMRQVYGQGAARTVGKLTVLSFAYLVAGAVVLLATSLYSVLAQ